MGRKGKKIRARWKLIPLVLILFWFILEGRFYIPRRIRPPKGAKPVVVEMETTSYCHCRKCCSYRWFLFLPYQRVGAFGVRLKHVGVTSSGAVVRPGSLAADTTKYPYGTIMRIPGYGYGIVQDTGGAIKGEHIDLYRPNHWLARAWGVRSRQVEVWYPQDYVPNKSAGGAAAATNDVGAAGTPPRFNIAK